MRAFRCGHVILPAVRTLASGAGLASQLMLGAETCLRLQELGGNATMLFYQSEEGNEVRTTPLIAHAFRVRATQLQGSPRCPSQGREAYMERRPPDFTKFKRLP